MTIMGMKIMTDILCFFDHDVEIKKGDAIGQLIFMKYLTADNDNAQGERKGGFGSTGR